LTIGGRGGGSSREDKKEAIPKGGPIFSGSYCLSFTAKKKRGLLTRKGKEGKYDRGGEYLRLTRVKTSRKTLPHGKEHIGSVTENTGHVNGDERSEPTLTRRGRVRKTRDRHDGERSHLFLKGTPDSGFIAAQGKGKLREQEGPPLESGA